MMERPFRVWLFTLLVCVIAVVLCVYLVDRSAAEFFNAHFRHSEWWIRLNHILRPFKLVPLAALFFLLGSGCWLISGRRLASWTPTLLLCSWSAIWGITAEIIFKQIFGRAWPDPTYIQNHFYGFHFLRGAPRWNSFPSGTATISTAILAVIWIMAPRFRWVGVFLTVALCSAVIVANDHWISDVIAGAFLGASIGWMTVLLPEVLRGPPPDAS